jgi:hypothetical protein
MHFAMKNRMERTVWRPNEWSTLCEAVIQAYPDREIRSAMQPSDMRISTKEFHEIMRQTLPEARWRTFKHADKFKYGLIKIFQNQPKQLARAAAAEQEVKKSIPPEETLPASPPQEAPATVTARHPPVTIEHAAADSAPGVVPGVSAGATSSAPPGVSPGASPGSRSPKVFWKPNEWLDIAREIYRLEPFAQHIKSSSLAGITLAVFKEAERNVIPMERRRPSINTTTAVRADLLKAFAIIRAEVEHQEQAEKNCKEQERIEEQRRFAQEQLEKKLNPYEEAFAPLVRMLATEITRMLVPAILSAQQQPEQPIEKIVEIASNVVALQNKPKKPRVAIVGPKPNQARELEQAFPELEIIAFENSNQVTAANVHSCDKIIGMTDYMRHGADGMLRKTFGDKYHRTTGTVSAVKRLIGVLLASEARQQSHMHH